MKKIIFLILMILLMICTKIEDSEGINTGGGTAGMMGDNPAEDIAAMPTGSQVGDTWTGPSGQTYIATFSDPELAAEFAAQGIVLTPYWKPK